MSATPHASREYLKSAVMTASPEQLQLMLLDGAIRFASRGREAIAAGDIQGAFNALDRAQRIVVELIQGMNREVNPTLVDQMAALYEFIFRRLIDANVHRDLAAVDDALRILRHQRETWALLIQKISREAPGAADATAESAPGATIGRTPPAPLSAAGMQGAQASPLRSTLSLEG